MKYTTTKQIKQEVEVTLPCYIKFSQHYTKIFNEKDCLIVENWGSWDFGIEIRTLSNCNPFGNDGWVFITEEEFNSVYQEVLEKVTTFQPQLNEEPA